MEPGRNPTGAGAPRCLILNQLRERWRVVVARNPNRRRTQRSKGLCNGPNSLMEPAGQIARDQDQSELLSIDPSGIPPIEMLMNVAYNSYPHDNV